MYQKHELKLVGFEETDVFTIVLNGSDDDGREVSGTSSYGGNGSGDM